jgi:hypothetical protein
MTSFPVGLAVALGLGLANPAAPATVVTGKVLPPAKVGANADAAGVACSGTTAGFTRSTRPRPHGCSSSTPNYTAGKSG